MLSSNQSHHHKARSTLVMNENLPINSIHHHRCRRCNCQSFISIRIIFLYSDLSYIIIIDLLLHVCPKYSKFQLRRIWMIEAIRIHISLHPDQRQHIQRKDRNYLSIRLRKDSTTQIQWMSAWTNVNTKCKRQRFCF